MTATRVCAHDASHVETETVSAASTATLAPTCTEAGRTTYFSAAFANPAFTVQTLTLTDIPAAGHEWTHSASTAAADGADGVRGATACPVCGTVKPERTVSSQRILRIPAMMKQIGEEAFAGVAAQQVVIPEGTLSIGARAFADCGSLLIAVIPASVNDIAEDAFAGTDIAVICPAGSHAAAWCDDHRIPHNP